MRRVFICFTMAALPILTSACASMPKPEPEKKPEPVIIETCYHLSALEKVVIPAVTKSGFSIVSIESPPEYYTDPKTGKTVTIIIPSIETRTPYTKTITPEEIYYKTPEGERITDICELRTAGPLPTPKQLPKLENNPL
ncbi:MAG: hypothetical protein JKX72_01575 [Robiginitomaculum sp.]|nr:hypothetical protein [Robiginitomaculum sp.]